MGRDLLLRLRRKVLRLLQRLLEPGFLGGERRDLLGSDTSLELRVSLRARLLPSTDLLLKLLHLTRRLSHLDSELLLFSVRLRFPSFVRPLGTHGSLTGFLSLAAGSPAQNG